MRLLPAILGLLTPSAHAVTLERAGQQNPAVAAMWAQICATLPFCNIGAAAPGFFAAKIARFIFFSIAGVGTCMLIYAGIRIVVSQGNEEGLNEAKKIGTYALAGIALAILAQAIIAYVEIWVLNQALG